MTDVTPRVERRGGKRYGPPRIALCGHFVEWFPGPYKKQCDDCAASAFVECRWCGSRCSRRGQSFCSPGCRAIGTGATRVGPRLERECALPECGVRFEPKYSAVRCCSERHGKLLYNRESRADGRQVNAWNDRRRNNAQARRARMKGARNGGSVFLGEIIERDGLDCHLCGRPVDMDLAWPHRDSKSVDHVIPLSRGGEHVLANCALAHMGCNSSKGAKLAA
jgi:5-methylcytosine-specific restriction endonuclease McrA